MNSIRGEAIQSDARERLDNDCRSVYEKMDRSARYLVQVVPRLLPGRCGISDHAILLAHELEKGFGIRSAFVVLTPRASYDVPFPVRSCGPDELLATSLSLNEGCPAEMLVHLSGYGYSPDGAPTLLAAALQRVKASNRFRIAVYFHELFASGPPWRSAFWHARRQRGEVRKIVQGCDLPITNTQSHFDWLERELETRRGVQVKLLPVFSTVGEAHDPLPFDCREPAMAVFGLAGARQAAYKQLHVSSRTLEQLGIRKIVDIGPGCGAPNYVNGIEVERMGELSIAEIARLFSCLKFGFVTHPYFCLAKSSVFAGYCAQGVVPVVAEPFEGRIDGLQDGIHLVSPATASDIPVGGLQACSTAAWQWYEAHRLCLHAKLYAKWIGVTA